METIQSENIRTDNIALSEAPSAAIKTARAVTFLLGGSGFSVGVVDEYGSSRGTSPSMPWSEVGVLPGVKVDPEITISKLFARLFQESRAILGGDIASVIGLAFAGPMEKFGADDYLVHGTNMGVTFNAPIKDTIIRFATEHGYHNLKREHVVVLNDGVAGALGELHSINGSARDCRDLTYIILGTGVGGARIVNGQVDPEFTETGHTLLRFRDGKGGYHYSYFTMEQLAENRLFQNGKFATPSNATYLEHRLGGPWVAVRFIKYLQKFHLADFESFHRQLRPEGCPDFSASHIRELSNLGERDVADWNRVVNKDTERAVNMMLRHHAAQPISGAISTSLALHARQYEVSLFDELASALNVLQSRYPDTKIVLGSSFAEIRRDDPYFRQTLGESVAVSHIRSGTERESAALAAHLK